MNLLHLKYAVEVAEAGSINRAADKLYVGQPNLSRAIRDLEASLGVTIFDRSAKGMLLTPDGEVFIRYARTILEQVDEVEGIFRRRNAVKQRFSLSAPRASYIADAFARFTGLLDREVNVDIFYEETNSMRAIKNVLQEDYRLGIIRYAENHDRYYKTMLEEKGLSYEMVTEFRYVLLVHRDSPLALKDTLTYADFGGYIEIAHADPSIPSLPLAEGKKEELPDHIRRRIFVFERASQFELLAQNHDTFMWVSPIPETLLCRYDLVQISVEENRQVYKDMLIHRKEYTLSELDHLFIAELCRAKREAIKKPLI